MQIRDCRDARYQEPVLLENLVGLGDRTHRIESEIDGLQYSERFRV
jgi:hypothetical protein